MASPADIELVKKLPKAELHLHIEGTLEPELMFELAKRNGVQIKYESVEAIRAAYKFNCLQEFLDVYYAGAAVLKTKQDFSDLTYAYMKRSHADNVRHAEIFFDPQTHFENKIEFETVLRGIEDGLAKAKADFGMTSHIIMSFLRHLPEEEHLKLLDIAKPFISSITGVGLDSSEKGFPPELFKEAYRRAIEMGLKPVAHAGEEGPAEYIWSALQNLHVVRIDHGVRSTDDPKLVEYLKEKRIPLTTCPLSNYCLKVFPELPQNNLKALLNAGLVATVNSDDPAYFGGYMNDNFVAMMQHAGITKEDAATLAKNSFDASWISDEEKKKYKDEIDALMQ